VVRVAVIGAVILLDVLTAGAGVWDGTEPNKDAVVDHLQAALEPIDGAARVYAVEVCRGKEGMDSEFPRIKMQAPSKYKTGPLAVREIFARDRRATVTTDSAGIPRITFGKPSCALLRTKIHELRFTVQERYDRILAQLAIENAREVQRAMRTLRVHQPTTVMDFGVQVPMPGVPRLPAVLHDVTMDEALDLIAKTFFSVVFYEEWVDSTGTKYFFIDQGCIVCDPVGHTPK
jgi:hypothetical protein